MKNYFSSVIPTQEKIVIIKRLAILLKAGVPILESLRMIADQTRAPYTKEVLNIVTTEVEKGKFLSVSLEPYKKQFGIFALNVIRLGEVSGSLHENLHYLARELTKQQQLQKKIIGALLYPALIMLATLGITGLLTVYVLPKIIPVFASLRFPLPWSTRFLIALSNFLLHHGLAVLVAGVFSVIVCFCLYTRASVQFWSDTFLLKLPIIGNLFRSYHIANFCRTWGLLMESHLTIEEALVVTTETVTNRRYKSILENMSVHVSRGRSVSEYLSDFPKFFPPLVCQLMSVGERTGSLSGSLLYLADMYESELDDLTKSLSTIIEPVLMIVMGVMVGFIAISIISPIYQLTQNLHP